MEWPETGSIELLLLSLNDNPSSNLSLTFANPNADVNVTTSAV